VLPAEEEGREGVARAVEEMEGVVRPLWANS